MIVKVSGQLAEKKEFSVVVNVQGLFYEVLVPASVMQRIDDHLDESGSITLITYYYIQLTPSSGAPVLIGFLSQLEKDFFLQFIKVSGIGPRAAVKALNKPISEISQAIDEADEKYLKTLPGIGGRKAKEIVAKLQGRIGRYGLIQDRAGGTKTEEEKILAWQNEALDVLLQLQYKKAEAQAMVEKALKRSSDIHTAEDLLNEIYKQRIS